MVCDGFALLWTFAVRPRITSKDAASSVARPKSWNLQETLPRHKAVEPNHYFFSKRRQTLRFFSRFERHDSFLFLLPASRIQVTCSACAAVIESCWLELFQKPECLCRERPPSLFNFIDVGHHLGKQRTRRIGKKGGLVRAFLIYLWRSFQSMRARYMRWISRASHALPRVGIADFKSAIFGRLSWKPKMAADLKSRLVGKSQLPLIKNEWDPMQDRAVLPCHSLFDCLFLPEPVSCRGLRIARSNGKRNRSFTRNKTTFAAVFEVLILIAMCFSFFFFFFFKYCNSKHLCAPHGARIHRPKCIRLTENCKKRVGYHFVKNCNASTHQPAHRKICLTPIMCIDMHFHSILFSLLLILPNTFSLILWCSYTEQLNKIKVHRWGSG